MSDPRRRAAARLLVMLLGALALLSVLPSGLGSSSRSGVLVTAQNARITCSPTSPCPESSPCCSEQGVCGSGAMQCAGGCDPMSSFMASSCLPSPVCRSRQMTIKPSDYNNNNVFMPVLEYNGNASSPFTLDAGSLGPGPEGVLLQLKAAQQAKISTTDYLMYGYVEATLRHNARQGLVAAFIAMSQIKDEIDYEFTTANSSVGMTNYFWMGDPVRDHGANVTLPNFNVSDWHTYGFNWTSSQLQWTIDGQVVRTVTREQAGNQYPRSPSRILFSTWAGGNETNPQGTIEWAGGPIDWNTPEYKKQGFYSQEIKQFNVQCASLSALNLTNVSGGGSTGNVTSFVYTGANSSLTGEPAFGTSIAPLRILVNPGADGIPGYPGYAAKRSQSGSNGKGGNNGNGGDGSSSSSNANGQSSNNNDAASASSGSTSSTLKYALPIAGVIVSLAAFWAILAFVCRRHLKVPKINAIGVTRVNDPRFSGPSSGVASRSVAGLATPAYQNVEHESAAMYRNEPNMNLMMGGGIMSDAGLSQLQRHTTGSSKVSRSSSRSVADRLFRNASKTQRYQQVEETVEEDEMEQVSKHSVNRRSTRAGGSYLSGTSGYHGHGYEQAVQEDEYDDAGAHRYGGAGSYYGTSISSPTKSGDDLTGRYYDPHTGENSFEACQLRSPQRRNLPVAPYMPNYAPAAPQRPLGRMYNTPNVNYYPTPAMPQNDGYMSTWAPFGAHADAYTPMAGAGNGGYNVTQQPRRY